MVDDTGKQFVYKNGHAFEDGDDNVDGIRKARMIQDGTLIERDQYYNEHSRPTTSSSRTESIQEDPYSLRRSRSNLSNSTGFEEKPRSKSKSRLFGGGGGGKKSKKDRHERTENAMGGAGHVFDDEFDRELQAGSNSNPHSAAGGFGGETSFPSNTRGRGPSFDDEGPEDPDFSIAKQYTGRAAPPTQISSSSRGRTKSNASRNDAYGFQDEAPPPVPKSKPARDVMDINHEF